LRKEGSVADVIVSSIGYLKQEIRAGKHVTIADEPLAAGGTDEGPGPYELLLASLGACTAMTLQVYARRKQWPLEKVEVSLSHDRLHAEDCAECVTKEGQITRIDRYISLTGELSEEQRSKLLEIAQRCPVHRTLTSEISIKDYLD
jgi:putative redox protein